MSNDTTKKNIVIVLPDMATQRIDNFLHTMFKGVPRSKVYRLLRTGGARVNRKRTKPQYKLQVGDNISFPCVTIDPSRNKIDTSKVSIFSELERAILYEDEYIIGLNKPSGIAVHGGSGVRFGIIEALRALRRETLFLELVHRLDRDASGVLLLAKKRSSLRVLHKQLRERGMKKDYLALVKGRWPHNIRMVNAPLLKSTRLNHKKMYVNSAGKPSITLFQIEENYAQFATLVKASLVTGRTHQIRVHASHVGHPIALDDRYGAASEFRQKLSCTGLNRLFLHAAQLSFTHPGNGEKISIEAPLDKQLQQCLKTLRG
ncbi:Ribosomal large subunit pseudouridine synthase C [Candidatus Erwinia haradaeae]|uniref:Pseudouridine synthase n=1 Tax=Candidatus Erwinia haradaeae TaxID=1922217 RepID=A0A451DC32_9GAMM|nr:23S rRNA pseudouridine(955/2504/2580) synthase RluC [Candidatus Erwinia haradaeae]VFP83979.1 Ribosomal large subunit pseudouridine synthase C [Candidatus Erwinia haradaeae]